MGRKKAHEEHENHERWLVSYADFITLLFAFFVVMYSISSLNEGKYKVLSQTMVAAFTGQPTAPDPVQPGQPFSSVPSIVDLPPLPRPDKLKPVPLDKGPGGAQKSVGAQETEHTLRKVARQIEALLASAIRKGDVQVRMTPLGVVIDIHDTVLFPSGQDALTPQAQELLDQIAGVLQRVSYPIQVNGFTDDRPISTTQFRSNWALSAARAVSVVEMFIAQGVSPDQLVAAGYGQYHPVASNDSPQGRAANRRVSVVIVSPLSNANVTNTPIVPAQAAPEQVQATAAALPTPAAATTPSHGTAS
jgi:chemotaxis protein MotB